MEKTRRSVLLGAGSAGLAAFGAQAFDKPQDPSAPFTLAYPIRPLASYQSIQPHVHSDVTLHVRRDTPESEFVPVGVQIMNGPIHFVSDGEAEAHVQAIWSAALRETDRVKASWTKRAEASIATYRKYGLTVSQAHADSIRVHCQNACAAQVAGYHKDVYAIMAERRTQIGPSHPELAIAIYNQVTAAQVA